MPFEYQTIQQPDANSQSEYRIGPDDCTKLVQYSDLHCKRVFINNVKQRGKGDNGITVMGGVKFPR
jgi:hypothetical protein